MATAGKLARKLDPIVPVTVVDPDGPVVRAVGFPCAPIVPQAGIKYDIGARIDWKKSRPGCDLVQLHPELPGLSFIMLDPPRTSLPLPPSTFPFERSYVTNEQSRTNYFGRLCAPAHISVKR